MNFRVYVRCCPPVDPAASTGTLSITGNEVMRKDGRCAPFDKVFLPPTPQAAIFQQVAVPLVLDFMRGKNATIFAYGQTGTGKTYTVAGDTRTPERAGLVPRVFEKLFAELTGDWSVEMTYVEIYNERLCDLFDNRRLVRIAENEISGAYSALVCSAANAMELYSNANKQRATAATNLNAASSRSHALLTLTLTTNTNNICVRSKLRLVDLAGSESVARSGAQKLRAHETGQINRSLLSLGQLIEARASKQKATPRDSKLTHLLQNSIGGETKTAMIATISLKQGDEESSWATVEYALRARSVWNPPQTKLECVSSKLALQSLGRRLEECQRSLRSQRQRDGGAFLPIQEYTELKATAKLAKQQQAELEMLRKREHDEFGSSEACEKAVSSLKTYLHQLEQKRQSGGILSSLEAECLKALEPMHRLAEHRFVQSKARTPENMHQREQQRLEKLSLEHQKQLQGLQSGQQEREGLLSELEQLESAHQRQRSALLSKLRQADSAEKYSELQNTQKDLQMSVQSLTWQLAAGREQLRRDVAAAAEACDAKCRQGVLRALQQALTSFDSNLDSQTEAVRQACEALEKFIERPAKRQKKV